LYWLFQLLGDSDTSRLTSPTFDFSGARGAALSKP